MTTLMVVPMWAVSGHFIGDFVLQSNWMATNKSKNFTALLLHVVTYTTFMGCCYYACGGEKLLAFFLVTAGLHLITDAVTSRLTTYFWFVRNGQVNPQLRRTFFLVVGYDQLLHYSALTWTLNYLR